MLQSRGIRWLFVILPINPRAMYRTSNCLLLAGVKRDHWYYLESLVTNSKTVVKVPKKILKPLTGHAFIFHNMVVPNLV